jgi:Zn-finger nucleic acid-binding protein
MKVLPVGGTIGSEKPIRWAGARGRMRPCPGCRAAHHRDPEGRCAHCGGAWLAGIGNGPLRRLVGKGPLTPLNCPDCGAALKSLDVPGAVHEGDLFWGLETTRPSGTCVAEGCPRCGGVWVDAGNLQRAGGLPSFRESLARVARDAS